MGKCLLSPLEGSSQMFLQRAFYTQSPAWFRRSSHSLDWHPIILATVGNDFAAYGEWLDRHGIRRDGIRVLEDEATAGAYIITDLDDNQIVGFHAGAMDRAHEAKLAAIDLPFDIGVVSPNGKRAMVENARELKKRGVKTVIDPGQGLPLFDAEELIELMEGAAAYTVNDYEWSLTLEKTRLTEAEVASRVGTAVITRGERGSILRRRGKSGSW